MIYYSFHAYITQPLYLSRLPTYYLGVSHDDHTCHTFLIYVHTMMTVPITLTYLQSMAAALKLLPFHWKVRSKRSTSETRDTINRIDELIRINETSTSTSSLSSSEPILIGRFIADSDIVDEYDQEVELDADYFDTKRVRTRHINNVTNNFNAKSVATNNVTNTTTTTTNVVADDVAQVPSVSAVLTGFDPTGRTAYGEKEVHGSDIFLLQNFLLVTSFTLFY